LLLYFALTLFVSAALLFFVQPLVGKMILPRLGGTPAVWNTCMVFFQFVLLVGYAYTHTLSTWRDHRRQLLMQLVLLCLPFLVLPFALGDWTPPREDNPVFSVLWLLLGMVGLPFFVVSTSAPLLQRWFGMTGHPAARDPYFLYGASNLGSMLALLLYPIAVEPTWAVETQAWLWTVAYGVFALLVAGCVVLVWNAAPLQYATASETLPEPLRVGEPDTAITSRRGVKRRVLLHASAPDEPAPQRVPRVDPVSAQRRFYIYVSWNLVSLIGAVVVWTFGGRTRFASLVLVGITVWLWFLRGRLGIYEVRSQPQQPVNVTHQDRITWLRRLRWIALAAAPSSLMLGVTTYLTTDIAAIPFFWVIPLALYLLTFILVFARWPVVWTEGPHTAVLYIQPCFLLFLVLIKVADLSLPWTWLEFSFHITAFFMTTLMCHGELAKDRPSTRHLTEFYLWMSVGGVLGGMFNALVAPTFFTFGVLEYPLAMILASLCRPNMVSEYTLVPGDSSDQGPTTLGRILDLVIPMAIAGVAYGLLHFFADTTKRSYLMAVPVILVLALAMRPLRFALGITCLLLAVWFYDRGVETLVFEDRGFFGFVKVRKEYHTDTASYYHTLIHGGINHGQQHLSPAKRRLPITYFHPTGGIGQVFQQYSWPDARLPASLVGQGTVPGLGGVLVDLHSEPPFCVVGLGTGTLAAHARPLQTMHIYEIDPLVRRLSLPPEAEEPMFTFVLDALDRGADLDIIMGDGRLRLREAPEKMYHILVLDAFSSDAIPVHLLTADAVGEYLDKLADGGVLIFNTTNRYVDIRGVLGKIAQHHDLECQIYGDYPEDIPDKFSSDWLVMRRKTAGRRYTGGPPLAQRFDQLKWQPPVIDAGPLWTDAYSNLFRVIHWK